MRVDCLLDGHLCAQVRSDLGHRSRLMLVHGRQWTSAEVLLRLVVIQHLYIWSYQETVEWVTASLMLCSFCRVCFQQVPTKATLLRWASAIQRETLHARIDRVVHLGYPARVIRDKLGLDSGCVQTTIYHPTNSSLLGDGVRMLAWLLQRAKPPV